eukprot:2944721-Prymnesium_polylepis.1
MPAKTVQPPCHLIFICDHIITRPPSSTGDGFNYVDHSMCVRICLHTVTDVLCSGFCIVSDLTNDGRAT